MKKDTNFWEECGLKDIAIGNITIKANHKGGWFLPGGKVTLIRGEAEAVAKRLNHEYMQREREQGWKAVQK